MTKTVTHIDNEPYFGDQKLLEIVGQKTFSGMIFETLSGNKPTDRQLKIFELILNISIDHGPDTPSAVETIKQAKDDKSISESIAAGINKIDNVHGGAIEPAMELFYKIEKEKLDEKLIVREYIDQDKRMAGFGHRIYTTDPRTQLIFKFAKTEGINNMYIEIAEKLSSELTAAKGKPIPINIDGAIAAVLCSFDWKPELGKAVFIIARTPGLCAQYINTRN